MAEQLSEIFSKWDLFYFIVVEASRIATVAILGGSTQWFDPDEAAELVCASTGSSLVDRLQWARLDGTMSPDTDDQNEPGILHFAQFKVCFFFEILIIQIELLKKFGKFIRYAKFIGI